GQGDGRLEEVAERPGTEAGGEGTPPGDTAGHGDGERPGQWKSAEPALAQRPGRRPRPRAPGRVQERDLAREGVPIEDEEVPAEAAHLRLDDGKDGVHRDGGVDDASPAPQYVEAGQRGERMRGGDEAVGAVGDGPVGVADDRHGQAQANRRVISSCSKRGSAAGWPAWTRVTPSLGGTTRPMKAPSMPSRARAWRRTLASAGPRATRSAPEAIVPRGRARTRRRARALRAGRGCAPPPREAPRRPPPPPPRARWPGPPRWGRAWRGPGRA